MNKIKQQFWISNPIFTQVHWTQSNPRYAEALPRALTIARGVVGAPAAPAPAAVGPGALHRGQGALVSGVTLLLLRNPSGGGPEAHPDLPQLFIDLEPFQSQLFYLLQWNNHHGKECWQMSFTKHPPHPVILKRIIPLRINIPGRINTTWCDYTWEVTTNNETEDELSLSFGRDLKTFTTMQETWL